MEKIVFFIYNVIRSDEDYPLGSKGPVYSTLFLISFFELFLFLPLIILINEVFRIVSFKAFLSFPMAARYLLIFASISLIGFVNYYFFARDNKMESLAEKYADRKDVYLRRKWLLVVFAVILAIVVLGTLTIIRMMLDK